MTLTLLPLYRHALGRTDTGYTCLQSHQALAQL